ncbi:hypothetical protein KR093_007118, partial [Drosophila rubida]
QAEGIRSIQVAGIAEPFEVFCDNETRDFPWIVMQRRVNRAVDFNQRFVNYTYGFGDLEGSYFLGLEKVYRLTSTQPYELYIHLEAFDGSTAYARYSDFLLANSRDSYRLKQLGRFTGNAFNAMTNLLGARFSTFDDDNDNVYREHCASKLGAGWWYTNCSIS